MTLIHNTSSEPLSRVAKTCKLLSKLCKIAFLIFVLWSAFAVILIFCSMFTADLPSDSFPVALVTPFVLILYSANASLIPWILGEMLSDLSADRTPFTFQNAKRLRALAIILVLYTVLEWLVIQANAQFVLLLNDGAFKVGNMVSAFSSEGGTTFNLFPLVIAAVFFALSYVFKYGVLLQQESDETL